MTSQTTMDETIFVIDDDQAVRDSLRWLLESVGHKVETFASAQEFLDRIDASCSGCLLLDVRMPGMSGIELQSILRERGYYMPIIIITGHGDVPLAVRAMKAGALEFIEKPFNDQLLLDKVQGCLAHAQSERDDQQAKSDFIRRLERLTRREREVLEAVIRGNPNKIVADQLGISVKTVEIHRSRVMEKMSAGSLAELVTLCIKAGIHTGKP